MPGLLAVDLVDAPCRPGEHRRVHVAERPLVGRHLAVGVLVPLAPHQHELVLGELGIGDRQRDAVEGEVPRREPRVLPLVGHRHHVHRVEVAPVVVASVRALARAAAAGRGRRAASDRRCSGRTACSTAARRAPGAGSARSSASMTSGCSAAKNSSASALRSASTPVEVRDRAGGVARRARLRLGEAQAERRGAAGGRSRTGSAPRPSCRSVPD